MAKAKAKKTVVSQKSGITLRKKKLANGTTSLYFDITPGTNGRARDYVFLKLYLTGNKEHDKKVLEVAEIAQAKLFLDRQLSAQSVVKPGEENFFKFLEAKYGERENAMTGVNHFRIFYGKTTLPMKDITPELIEKYRLWLEKVKSSIKGKQLKTSTQRIYFDTIVAGIKDACKQKLLVYDFSTIKRPKKAQAIRRFLDLNEARQLSRTPVPANKRMHPHAAGIEKSDTKRAFLFACCVGLRWSDIKQLRGRHFSGARVQKLQQKTETPVFIPLSDSALSALSYLPIDPDELVFKLPKSNLSINRYLKQWSEAAGLRHPITFHTSRHTFAALLLSNNVGIYTVQQLLGHSDISSTLVYAHMLDKVKEEAVQQLPNLSF